MHPAIRYSSVVLLSVITGLPHYQALAQQQEDEAVINHKIEELKTLNPPSVVTGSATFVVIRSSLPYDPQTDYMQHGWEKIRLGCLSLGEIGQRLCQGIGASNITTIASGRGGTCGISLYLVECSK
jgi:hypothetical protein